MTEPTKLLAQIDAILDVAVERLELKDMRVYILAAQHKIELLKEQLEELGL